MKAGLALDFSVYSDLRQQARGGDQQALREAARQFEAIFVRTMLHSARASAFGDDGLGDSGGLVRDLRDRQLAEQLTQGRGFGLAEMLVRQLGGQARPGPRPDGLAAYRAAAAPQPAAASGFASRSDFVASLRPHAERAAAKLGVSAKVLLAQAALETDWGRRLPGGSEQGSSHNLFGIKAGAWSGDSVAASTTEFRQGEAVREVASFRSYASFADSFDDYVRLLQENPRYRQALEHRGSDENFLRALKFSGYATDPQYVEKILQVADSPVLADVV